MKLNELLTEEEKGWLDTIKSGLGKMWTNNPDEELYKWIGDNVHKKGTQWIYRNVDKQFPKRYVKTDIDKALKSILGRG